MKERSLARSHEIVVPRTARYVTLGPELSGADEVWLTCHGYGQLASRFIRRFDVIDNGRRLIVAPEALSRFYLTGGTGPHSDGDKVGASWMTREGRDSEITDQVTYFDLVRERILGGKASSARWVGFGFSQGAAVICRWAARAAQPPAHLVLWGSGVPAELLEGDGKAGLARASLTIVMGAQDPIADAGRVEAHKAELDAARISYRFVSYEGGHDVDGPTLAGLAEELAAGFKR